VHAVTGVASALPVLPSRDAVMVQSGRENFPVASIVLGPRRQRHLLAIYGFARLVDDVGDEAAGNRDELLDVVEDQLGQIYAGEQPAHPIMQTLAVSARECALPVGPFRRLIEANRQDQVVTRYETFDQLMAYCRLSATPVGELVLRVFDAASPDRVALSDRICAGLQIVEHLQDINEDYQRGRVYMPREDMLRFGCDEEALTSPGHPSTRALIAFEAGRARSLLAGGAPLARTLPLRPRIAVAGFVAGGRAALDALERSARAGSARPRELRPRGLFIPVLKAIAGR
jgi:squalene synthase HpnC